jgi:hypothetical protein
MHKQKQTLILTSMQIKTHTHIHPNLVLKICIWTTKQNIYEIHVKNLKRIYSLCCIINKYVNVFLVFTPLVKKRCKGCDRFFFFSITKYQVQ